MFKSIWTSIIYCFELYLYEWLGKQIAAQPKNTLSCANQSAAYATTVNYSVAKSKLADYFSKMLDSIPDYFNIAKVGCDSIKVEIINDELANVEVMKKDLQKETNLRYFSTTCIPHMNEILANIRLRFVNELMLEKAQAEDSLCVLLNENLFDGDNSSYERKCTAIQNAYYCYVQKIQHYLYHVTIDDFEDKPSSYIFKVNIRLNETVDTVLNCSLI